MAGPQYGAPGGQTLLPAAVVDGLVDSGAALSGRWTPQRSARGRRSPVLCAAPKLDIPEKPQRPAELLRNRDVARLRSPELQGIFVSKHATEYEALQKRLKELDTEETSLRSALLSLQNELEEATELRRVREDLGDTLDMREGGNLEQSEGSRGESHEKPEQFSPGGGGSPAHSPSASRREGGRSPSTSRFAAGKEHPMAPILNRRRAEARLREATAAHETSMAQMRSTITDIERRSHKQHLWMQNVEKQILDAEIEKVSARVRLDKAEKRARALSKDLSRAYDSVVELLEGHLKLQDGAARNDALVTYLDVVAGADIENEINFIENRAELNCLLALIREQRGLDIDIREMLEETSGAITFCSEALQSCQELTKFNNGLQSDWVRIPAGLKESKFAGMSRTRSDEKMHPVTAMQNISESLSSMSQELQALMELLSRASSSGAEPSQSVWQPGIEAKSSRAAARMSRRRIN